MDIRQHSDGRQIRSMRTGLLSLHIYIYVCLCFDKDHVIYKEK